jgi:hypothetical protein
MDAYHPTIAEISDAETYFGNPKARAHDHDYCVDHAGHARLPRIAPLTGKAPTQVAEAIALGQEITGPIAGINDPLSGRGMTLLHLAALLYSRAAQSYAIGSRGRAQYYERVCRLLLDFGADPLAKMSTDGLFGEKQTTPAAVCEGCQPLCLRARMLREAADGRFESQHYVINHMTVKHKRRTSTPRKTAFIHRIRQARGVTDTGEGWQVQAQDGAKVAVIAYDPTSKTDRWHKHHVAILAREQYEHQMGFSNARRRA